MSEQSFESIVDGQFAPIETSIMAWYEFDLDSLFEEIDPNSAVGRMAVELEGARRDTDTSTVEDHDLAYSRWKVFAGMYYDLHAQPAGSNYQATVSAALGRGIKELDRVWIPEGSKPELVALNQEIGLFLGIESDLHFKDLA